MRMIRPSYCSGGKSQYGTQVIRFCNTVKHSIAYEMFQRRALATWVSSVNKDVTGSKRQVFLQSSGHTNTFQILFGIDPKNNGTILEISKVQPRRKETIGMRQGH
ncbi:hypothetical protein MKW92_017522 [Papaver armeniacum]|nr:hypothetical protein MKW92_017522 [Papaver armeniacum]